MAYPAHQLAVPPAAQQDAMSFEMVRLWAANGAQHVALHVNPRVDPASWGLLLADLARHVARAYEQQGGPTASAALERIVLGLSAELESPTDEPTGGLSHPAT